MAASPLSITNVDSPDPVQTGSQILYTIVITNTGGAKVSNAVLTDQYNGLVGFGNPPLLDAVSSRGSCSQNNTQVTCNGGAIEGGGVWTVTIRGVVSAAGGTTINNNATVTGTKSAQTFTNSASATTQVTGTLPGGNSPDLTIGKNGPLSAAAGGPITYTMTINNVGNATATGVKVTDTLPQDISNITVGATSLFTCSANEPVLPHAAFAVTVTCIGGQVNAGASATITVHGTVSGPGPLVNTAVVDPDNTIDEGVIGDTQDFAERNNTSNTVTTNVSPIPPPPPPPITIDKVKVGGLVGIAVPGELVEYRITVTNGTLGRADYLTMTDTTQGLQAASLKVLSATSESGTTPICAVSAPIVTCTMTRLAVGDDMVIRIQGMVVASAGSTIINNATVNANIKNTGYTATDQVQTTIKPAFDLTITKSDTPDPVCASSFPEGGGGVCQGGLRYDFVIGNSGLSPAPGVVVRDVLPVGTLYDDSASSLSCAETSPGVVTCTVDVPAEGTAALHIVVVAPAVTGSITNTVTVDPANAVFESDETNNIAIATTLVSTGIDLTIVKDDETNDLGDVPPDFNVVNSLPGFDPIATSGTQTYTITVDNIGTQDATDMRVRDTLPAGTIFLSVSADNDFTCTHDGALTGGVVECIGGDIHGTNWESYDPDGPAGPNGPDSATIIIKVFARPTVGTMTNEVRVDPLNEIAEANETNNIDTESTTVVNGDGTISAFNELSITKADTPDPVSTSGVVTYTIVATNNGTDPAVNVVVRDFLPAGFTYIEAADTSLLGDAFFCSFGAGNTVECAGATLPGAGGNRTIVIRAFASSTPGLYTNQARIDPDHLIPEGNETNNQASAQTTVEVAAAPYIDLRITKTDTPDPVTPGGTITWTVTVENVGTNPAFGVVVRDQLPAGTTFISATDDSPSPGDFICSEAGGVVTCSGATLDGLPGLIPTIGNSRILTIKASAPLANISIQNQVFVDPFNAIPEGDETNNSATTDTLVQSNIDLQITKTGPKSAHQNDVTQYVLTVKNDGVGVANDVLVTDPLPTGLIPLVGIVATPGNFACQVLENPVNVVSCVGDLNGKGDPNGFDQVTITIPVFITADGGTLDNQACVDPNDTIVESHEDNNCSTNVTPVTHKAPDLLINKSVDKTSVTPGDQITYTLTISNNGDADADGPVTVTDTLPSQADFVSSNPDAAFTCPAPVGTTLTCSAAAGLTVGQSAQITIIMTVQSPLPSGTTSIDNSATVSAGTCSAPCENEAVAPSRLVDNSASVTSTVGGSAIDLVMVNGSTFDAPDPVVVGQKLTYTIVVTNAGSASTSSDPAPNTVVVRATLPAGLDLDSAAASGGFVCTPAGPATGPVGDVDCSGVLAAGDSVIVTLTTTVTATAGTSLSVLAEADPDHDIVESNEGNNSKTAITSVVAAPCLGCYDLVAGSIVSTPVSPVLNNTDVTYNFIVTNVGDQSTNTAPNPNDVVVSIDLDTIFNESTPVSVSAPGFTCVTTSPPVLVTDPEIVCTNATGLAGGDGALFSVVVHANTAATPSYVDFDVDVKVLTGEFNPANNSSSLRVFTHA